LRSTLRCLSRFCRTFRHENAVGLLVITWQYRRKTPGGVKARVDERLNDRLVC